MKEEPKQFNEEQIAFVSDLLSKAQKTNDKTCEHRNATLLMGEYLCYLRVDDRQLLYLGARLLPNIVNYLVNVLPTLIYPYIVAYLQDLSDDDQPITVTDLCDLVESLESKIDD